LEGVSARTHDLLFEWILSSIGPEAVHQLLKDGFDPELQAVMDDFAERNTEGELTEAEYAEYEALVSAVDLFTLLRLRARARLIGAKPQG
jgi:hypothetical protein